MEIGIECHTGYEDYLGAIIFNLQNSGVYGKVEDILLELASDKDERVRDRMIKVIEVIEILNGAVVDDPQYINESSEKPLVGPGDVYNRSEL